MSATKRAVVLLSGGLDSATALAMCQAAGFEAYAISFRYGQRHAVELSAAAAIARQRQVARHIVVDIDLRPFGGSALTADGIPVPKHGDVAEIEAGIPVTYVPARNTIFLSLALGWAETLDTGDLFVGVNAVDYSGYPDCRPEYIAAFQAMARLATRASVLGERPVTVHAPLIHWTKAEIIRRGMELGVDYSLTTSCYDPDSAGRACGACDSCLLRRRGFADAQVADPTRYATV